MSDTIDDKAQNSLSDEIECGQCGRGQTDGYQSIGRCKCGAYEQWVLLGEWVRNE